MTEPQAYKLMLEAEEEEEEEQAGAKFHELLGRVAPANVGPKFTSGESGLLEELLQAEAIFTEKRQAANKARKVWLDLLNNVQ